MLVCQPAVISVRGDVACKEAEREGGGLQLERLMPYCRLALSKPLMSASISKGLVVGAKRLNGLPSASNRNLVKFHLTKHLSPTLFRERGT